MIWHITCGFLCALVCLESSCNIKEGTIDGSWVGYFNFMYLFRSLVDGFSY